ncbi:hypothetical protein AB0939_17445 [Streptomyces sp. NPDC006990]|uniref:hypothetical protein n=1 Tax=unclassified Streptomyces TaxID=2593676 RepID=UPI00345698D1
MSKVGVLAAALAAAAVLTTGCGGSAVAAGQDAASARSSTCATVWTSNGKGSIRVCWSWYRSSGGGSYYGSYWGTFYDHAKDGKWVILQAKWAGRGWKPVQTAANKGTFSADYRGLKGLTFRACLTGGHCGSPAV